MFSLRSPRASARIPHSWRACAALVALAAGSSLAHAADDDVNAVVNGGDKLTSPFVAYRVKSTDEYSRMSQAHRFYIRAPDVPAQSGTANEYAITQTGSLGRCRIDLGPFNNAYRVSFRADDVPNLMEQCRMGIRKLSGGDYADFMGSGRIGDFMSTSSTFGKYGWIYYKSIPDKLGNTATHDRVEVNAYNMQNPDSGPYFWMHDKIDHHWHLRYDELQIYTSGNATDPHRDFELYRLNGSYPKPIVYYTLDDIRMLCNQGSSGGGCASGSGLTQTTDRFGTHKAVLFSQSDYGQIIIPASQLTHAGGIDPQAGEHTLSFWMKDDGAAKVSGASVAAADWASAVTISGSSGSHMLGLGGVATAGGALSLNSATRVRGAGGPINWQRRAQTPMNYDTNVWTHVVVSQSQYGLYIYTSGRKEQTFGELDCGDYHDASWPIVYYQPAAPDPIATFFCTRPLYQEQLGMLTPLASRTTTDAMHALGVPGITNMILGARDRVDGNITKPVPYLDEVLVFNRALTPQEVYALHSDQLISNYLDLAKDPPS